MFRHTLMKFAVPAAITATLLLSAPAWAQHHGGGHGGHGGGGGHGGHGGHGGGGGHIGGSSHFHAPAHVAVPRAAPARAYGGYHGGSYARYSPYRSGYGYYGHHHHHGYYGYYPWFGGGVYAPSYYSNYYGNFAPDYGSYANDYYPYTYPYNDYGYTYADNYTDVPAAAAASVPANAAVITVEVPSRAEVWFGNTRMGQTGSIREFASPPLTPGMDYSYDIRARWLDNGMMAERSRHIVVRAGDRITVNFVNGG